MDWFERLTGFRETSYHDTRARLSVTDGRLSSEMSGRDYGVGTLELLSLAELRTRATEVERAGRLTLDVVTADVRRLHQHEDARGALFQVASQFNLLEMVGPEVTPERGVTIYEHDRTQGPACAIAAGAATIYRNYFVSVDGAEGQTAGRQLDGLADLGRDLATQLGTTVDALWTMRNGYALASQDGLQAIGDLLRRAGAAELDRMRSLLRIGLQSDVEVTDGGMQPPQVVSQAFCSALPVAYSRIEAPAWAPFAQLILEAAYEATLLAGLLNASRGASNKVYLTRLGGGAFGNDDAWIDAAMLRALSLVTKTDLSVSVVSYGAPSPAITALTRQFEEATRRF